jgi:hypothetical protein
MRFAGGWSASRSATCKAAENDCLERRNSIRPCVTSHVAYKAKRGGNELFWSPWKMYPRSQERHRNREATVYLPALGGADRPTPAFDGGAQPDSKRPLENIRLERNYFRGISREALHQQNAGKKAGWVFPCQRRAVHLENLGRALRRNQRWCKYRVQPTTAPDTTTHKLDDSHCEFCPALLFALDGGLTTEGFRAQTDSCQLPSEELRIHSLRTTFMKSSIPTAARISD